MGSFVIERDDVLRFTHDHSTLTYTLTSPIRNVPEVRGFYSSASTEKELRLSRWFRNADSEPTHPKPRYGIALTTLERLTTLLQLPADRHR